MRRALGQAEMQHLKKAAERYSARDPDAQLFLKPAREALEDCLAAIERCIAQTKKRNG